MSSRRGTNSHILESLPVRRWRTPTIYRKKHPITEEMTQQHQSLAVSEWYPIKFWASFCWSLVKMPIVSTVFGQWILSWLCAPGFHLNVRFCQSGAMSVPDYYSVLGVERDARPAQIKKARLGYFCQIAWNTFQVQSALDDLSSQRQWQHLILNRTTWKQRDEIPQFEKDSKFCHQTIEFDHFHAWKHHPLCDI